MVSKLQSGEKEERAKTLASVSEVVYGLRAPGGCPWDQKQTHESLKRYVLEEAYEVCDAIDARTEAEKNSDEKGLRSATENLNAELGDLLLQVFLHAEIASEHPKNSKAHFNINTVASALEEKLVRRHPHVFGDIIATTSEQVLKNWDEIKKTEKKTAGEKVTSVLDGVLKSAPSLVRAEQTIQKVTKVGFQWPDLAGPLAKVREELGEFEAELLNNDLKNEKRDLKKLESELGDLLFCVANLGTLLGISSERALQLQLDRFHGRFKHVEKRVGESGKNLTDVDLNEMDKHWNEAKLIERTGK